MDVMPYRRMGASGLKVSTVGLGCNNFGRRLDEAGSKRVVSAALECGINLFDTADVYGDGASERFLGAAVKGQRDQVVIATKFRGRMGSSPNHEGGSRVYIRHAVEASLTRLGTDYIDLYQMHSPDPETPIEETLSTLNDLVREGKVRYVGSSNFAGWQIADADWTARVNQWERFISAQNHYSLLHREPERDVIPACTHYRIGVLPYFPLAGGMLTGKYRRSEQPPTGTRLATSPNPGRFLNEANFATVEALEAFAQQRGLSLVAVAIGGLAAQPQVASVIAGATSADQVRANVAAGAWTPSAEDLAEINRITEASATG